MIGPTPTPSRLIEQVRAPAADDGQDRLLQLACLLQHRVRATSQIAGTAARSESQPLQDAALGADRTRNEPSR
jgi:hypothetical protein